MKIIKVTDNNINEVNNLITKKNQKMVAKFTADWCGHCKDLNNRVMPGVEEIIKNQPGPGILLSVSDLMMPKLQGIDTRINGFPSIRSFVGGKKKKDYNGKREVKDLAKFIKKSLGKCRKTKKKTTVKTKKKRKKRKKKKKQSKKVKRRNRSAMRERFFKFISLK